jgi:hypothetical protein
MMRKLFALAIAFALLAPIGIVVPGAIGPAFANQQAKPVVAKRCGSRGGVRRSRSYYGYGC